MIICDIVKTNTLIILHPKVVINYVQFLI